MLFPDKFITSSGKKLNAQVEQQHIEHLAAVIGKTIQLDWVQTWFAHKASDSAWDFKGQDYVD